MKYLVVGTAGHIDHGKSALVQALTGMDPDRLKEEKARGISIELGFAHVAFGGVQLAFVDVPGHERFVRTMLAGAGGIDFVMLVIAADESVMPQTREHFDICRLLGVADGCVVTTKSDLVDGDGLALVALEAADLVRGSFLEGKPIVPVSAVTGDGLETLRAVLLTAAGSGRRRPDGGAARLPIDRVFSVRGFGTVVTGTLMSGRVTAGQELELVPGGSLVKVRGLQGHGRSLDTAVAGQRVALNLGGVDRGEIGRGQTLAAAGSLSVTRRVDVEAELLATARPLWHTARVRVHHGTAAVMARVSLAGAGTADIEPGRLGLARLRLEAPLALTRGDRLILRACSPPATIGAATVLDPMPVSPRVRSVAGLQRLERLRRLGPVDALAAMVAESGLRGLALADIVARAGVPPGEVQTAVATLEGGSVARPAGDRLVDAAALAAAGRDLLAEIRRFHDRHPLSEGLPREEARTRLFGGVDGAVFEAVLAHLVKARAVVDRERLADPAFRRVVPGGEGTVAAVEAAYRDAGLAPPDAAAVAGRLGLAVTQVEAAATYLIREKRLARIGTLLVHVDALASLKADLSRLKEAAPGEPVRVDVGQFKERYGVTRKFAIPLLEYLDRERVTRRVGDTRVLL